MTVTRLEITGSLLRTMLSTNPVESMIETFWSTLEQEQLGVTPAGRVRSRLPSPDGDQPAGWNR